MPNNRGLKPLYIRAPFHYRTVDNFNHFTLHLIIHKLEPMLNQLTTSHSFEHTYPIHSNTHIPFIRTHTPYSFEHTHSIHSNTYTPFIRTDTFHSFEHIYPIHSNIHIPFIRTYTPYSFEHTHPIPSNILIPFEHFHSLNFKYTHCLNLLFTTNILQKYTPTGLC